MPVQVKNPHSVLAALLNRPKDVKAIAMSPTLAESDQVWGRVAKLAREHKIPMQSAKAVRPAEKGERGDRGDGRVGIAEATIVEKQALSCEELFADAQEKKGGKGLWLALDCLQDPHNVGAIFRAASFFGVQGILMTQERSAPLSSTVYDISCGGIETVPFASQVNLRQALESAKEAGLWILGTSEHAHDSYLKIDRDRPWLLVLGNEEKGMRRLTEESCDLMCRVDPISSGGNSQGQVTSLNVSVAAGILISRFA